MSAPISVQYDITAIDPVEPIAGAYTVTIDYVLSSGAVPDFTSEVKTTIQSALLYQNVTTDMGAEARAAQIKRNFELAERPAFELYARRAKEARDQINLTDDLSSFTGGVVAMQASIMRGVVSPL